MTTVLKERKERFKELVQPILEAQRCSADTRPLAETVFNLMVCKHTPPERPEYIGAERVLIRNIAKWFELCGSERVGDFAQFLLEYLGDKSKHAKIFSAVAGMCDELKRHHVHIHEEITIMEEEAVMIAELTAEERDRERVEDEESELLGDPIVPSEMLPEAELKF
jgi:hypothetical protein